jgi:hypothetical protein
MEGTTEWCKRIFEVHTIDSAAQATNEQASGKYGREN